MKLKIGEFISTDLPDHTGDLGVYVGDGLDINGRKMTQLMNILWLNKRQMESIFVSDLDKYYKIKITGFGLEKGIEFKKVKTK